MMNRLNLVGIVKSYSGNDKNEESKANMSVYVEVERSYGEAGTKFKSDVFEIILSDTLAKECLARIKVNDIIGILGHVETEIAKTCDGREICSARFFAEKVSYISNKKIKEGNN